MRERAVGQRIMMYWHIDDSFYPATITAFDELHYRHRVEHDDGDIEPAVKLWEAQVNLEVCTLIQSFYNKTAFSSYIISQVEAHIVQTPSPIARPRTDVFSPEDRDSTRRSVRKRFPRLPYDQTHQHKSARAL
jgi:hypothetical protein